MTLTEVVLAVRAAILTEVVTILSVVSLVIEAEAEVLGQGDELEQLRIWFASNT